MAATEQNQLSLERERNDKRTDAAHPAKPRKKNNGMPMHKNARATVVKANQATNLNLEVFIGLKCLNNQAQAGLAKGAEQAARRNPALPQAEGSPSDDQLLRVACRPGGLRSPVRGGLITAQGKAAEAAALGKHHPAPKLSCFQSGLAPLGRAKPDWKQERESFCVSSPGRRSFLACPGLLSYRPYRTSIRLAPLA